MNCQGMLFLYRLQFSNEYKALKKYCSTALSGPSSHWLLGLGTSAKEVHEKFIHCILLFLFPKCREGIPTQQEFANSIEHYRQKGFFLEGKTICDNLISLLRKRRELLELSRKLLTPSHKNIAGSKDENLNVEQLMSEILPETFLTHALPLDFHDISRQFQSLSVRIERYSINQQKDGEKAKQLEPFLSALQKIHEHQKEIPQEALSLIKEFETMIWEFRISLFSPEIKTRFPVSAKRLNEQLKSLRSYFIF